LIFQIIQAETARERSQLKVGESSIAEIAGEMAQRSQRKPLRPGAPPFAVFEGWGFPAPIQKQENIVHPRHDSHPNRKLQGQIRGHDTRNDQYSYGLVGCDAAAVSDETEPPKRCRHRRLEGRSVHEPILQREHHQTQLGHRTPLGLQVNRFRIQ
jgi:hypothetical protein